MAARILVFGESGQVARALGETTYGFEMTFAGRARLDLAAPDADIASLIEALRPDAVINAAAYTAVDRAEAELEACARLNRDAPIRMAGACAAADIPLVHFSTDYVFDGKKGAPYVEGDARRPINAYGRSKAEGEAALEAFVAAGARIAVIRTAWVFAPGGGGFFGMMLRQARETKDLAVADDQWSSPTPASACASAALTLTRRLLDRDAAAHGMFHAAGRDGMSRADFAEAIFAGLAAHGEPAPTVRRVPAATFAAAARRPRDTRLSSARLEAVSDWRAPALETAVADCLARMERLAG